MRLKFINDGGMVIVWNKNELLGTIEYYKKWKCYVWDQDIGVIMSSDCLQEVVNYMETKNKLMKKIRGGKVP